MANVHTPQRLEGELQQQYSRRRAASKAVTRTLTKGPTQAPAVNLLDVSRFFLGQHTNPEKHQRRYAIAVNGGIRQFKRNRRAQHAYWADPMRLVEMEAEYGDPLLQD